MPSEENFLGKVKTFGKQKEKEKIIEDMVAYCRLLMRKKTRVLVFFFFFNEKMMYKKEKKMNKIRELCWSFVKVGCYGLDFLVDWLINCTIFIFHV